MTETTRVTFTRCPSCQAVAWPGWNVTHRHRPPCPHEGTNPTEWETE